jgi:hypothetical protein
MLGARQITPPDPVPSPSGFGRGAEERYPLHSAEFTADPHRAYQEMRERHGALAPVEPTPGVPATLVIGHLAALRILNDPVRFPADPRHWEKTVPADCPMLPVPQYRLSAQRSAGVDSGKGNPMFGRTPARPSRPRT